MSFRIIDDMPGWTGPAAPTEDWEARRPFIWFQDGTIIIGLPGEHHVNTRLRHDRNSEYGEEGYVMKGLVDHPDEVRLFNAQHPLRHEIEEAVSEAVGVPVGGDAWSFAKVAAVQVNPWAGPEAFGGERTPVLADLDNAQLHVGPKGGFHSDIFHALKADKNTRPFVHGYYLQNGSYVWNDMPEPPPEYGAALHQHVLNTVGRAEPFDVMDMWGFGKQADVERNPEIPPQHMHNWQEGKWGKGMLLRNGEVHTWKTSTEQPGTDLQWDHLDGWPTHGAYHSMLMNSRGYMPEPGIMKPLPNDYRMEQMFLIYPDGLTTASAHNREHINAGAPNLVVPDQSHSRWNFREAQQPVSQPPAQLQPDIHPSVFEVQHASQGHGDDGRPYVYDSHSQRLYLGQPHGRHWELIDATPELHREVGPHLHSLPPSAKSLEFGRVYDNHDHLEVRHFRGEDKEQSPEVTRLIGGHLNKPAIATQGIAPWDQPHTTQTPYNWNWAPSDSWGGQPAPAPAQAIKPALPIRQADLQRQQHVLNHTPEETDVLWAILHDGTIHSWDRGASGPHHYQYLQGLGLPVGLPTDYRSLPARALGGYQGGSVWSHIGTPEDLAEIAKVLQAKPEEGWDFTSAIAPKIIEHEFDNTNIAGGFDGYEGRRPIVFANNTVHVGPEGVTHSDLARHVINKGYYEIDHGARQGWVGHNPESFGSDELSEPGTANELGWYGSAPDENTNRAIYEYFSAKPTQGWFFAKKEDKRAKPQKCSECKKPAIKSLVWAEGMAYVPVCADHEQSMRAHLKAEDGEGAFQEVAIKESGLFPKREPSWDFATQGDTWRPILRMQDGTIVRGEPGQFHHDMLTQQNINSAMLAQRGHELADGQRVWYGGQLGDRIGKTSGTDPFDAFIGTTVHPWQKGEYGKALVNPTTGQHVHWGVGTDYDGMPTHSDVRDKLGVPDFREKQPHPWDTNNAHSMVIAPDGRVTVLDALKNKSNVYESEKILADAIGGKTTGNLWYFDEGEPSSEPMDISRESGIYGEDWGEGTVSRPQPLKREFKAITMRDGTRHEWPVTGPEGTPHHGDFITQEGLNPRDIQQYHWTHDGQWVNGPEQPEWDFKQLPKTGSPIQLSDGRTMDWGDDTKSWILVTGEPDEHKQSDGQPAMGADEGRRGDDEATFIAIHGRE